MANEPTNKTAQAQRANEVRQAILAQYQALKSSGEKAQFSMQCKKLGLPRPWLKATTGNRFASQMAEWKAKLQATN